ncbi:MAG: AAA family ATPase [Pseudomonadota bacterium]
MGNLNFRYTRPGHKWRFALQTKSILFQSKNTRQIRNQQVRNQQGSAALKRSTALLISDLPCKLVVSILNYKIMLARSQFLSRIDSAFQIGRVCAILGPRQCGKTTLAEAYVKDYQGPKTLFDLEDPRHLSELQDPMLALESLNGLVIIDEIQRLPELFPILRVLVDHSFSPDLSSL